MKIIASSGAPGWRFKTEITMDLGAAAANTTTAYNITVTGLTARHGAPGRDALSRSRASS